MSELIDFSKQSFNKFQYEKIIDTSFKQLGVQPIQQQLEEQPTLNDFFNMYNEMFYEIPESGEINSHEYLIKQSSEYIGFESNQEELEVLQNEIAQLRIELLDAQKQIAELQTKTPVTSF